MNRRKFIQNTLVSTAAATATAPLAFGQTSATAGTNQPFKLKFAPHDGMFNHHAGDSILHQLRFMADQGFTAFEDNEMRNRPIAEQEAIGKLLTDLGMEMGVFVAHKIYWDIPNLTSGNAHYRHEFLTDIRIAVDIAKRINAKWMTVD